MVSTITQSALLTRASATRWLANACLLVAVLLCLLATLPVQAQPFGMAINTDGDDPQMAPDHLYRINLANGEAVDVGPTGFQDIETLAFDANSQLWGVDDSSNTLLRMDGFSGSGIPFANATNNLGLNATTSFDFGLTFTCAARPPLLSSDTNNQLFSLDLDDNGRATALGSSGDISITALASAVINGQFRIFGLGAGDINPNLYSIDPDTYAISLIGPLAQAAAYNDAGLAFDAQKRLWAITDRTNIGGQNFASQILRIDITSGTATVIAETITGVESLAITALDCSGIDAGGGDDDPGDPGGVPEPEAEGVPTLRTPALLLLMLMVLGVTGRRLYRRKH